MKLSEFKPAEEVREKVRKCATAEDVKKLAREYGMELTAEEIADVLKCSSLTELKAEQLDLVAGGEDEDYSFLPDDRGIAIGKYEAETYIGKDVYLVYAHNKEYVCGTLVRSWEKEDWIGSTRTHTIFIKSSSEIPPFEFGVYKRTVPIECFYREYEFNGNSYQLFLRNES